MRTVLLVEDDHDTRVAMREALEEEGICVFSAANGKDGFELLQSLKPPLLVLLDQNMPIATGDDFLRQRLRHPALAAIPVIVMSAVVDRTTHLGANDFINKPIDMDALIKKIKVYLGPGSTAPPAAGASPADKAAPKGPKNSKPGGSSKKFAQLFEGFRQEVRALGPGFSS